MTYKLTNTSQPADPYYGAVSVLLDGRAFEDRSVNPKTIGGTFVLNTNQSKWHGISYNTGSSYWKYMSVQNTGGAFDFGSGDFTIEFWMRPSYINPVPNTSYRLLNFNSGYKPVYMDLRGAQLRCFASSSGTAWDVSINSGLFATVNVWQHVAFVRSGNTFTPYLDGVAGNSATLSDSLVTTTSNLNIGSYSSGTPYPFYGNFNDIRITKGVARYTSNFTPPTRPFQSLSVRDPQFNAVSLLLKGEGVDGSTTIVDSSPTPKTVTAVGDAQISTAESKFSTSSLYFDGSGDYLSTGPDSNLALGSGDFTVEAFIYVTSLSSNSRIASSRALNVSGDLYWLFNVDSSGRLNFQSRTSSGTQYYAQSNTSAITTNTWYHVAGVRHNNILTVYIDGVAGPTTANDGGNDLSESYVGVGVFNYPGFVSYFPGYIDDLRITKGVARYTSNFTPPGPLPTY